MKVSQLNVLATITVSLLLCAGCSTTGPEPDADSNVISSTSAYTVTTDSVTQGGFTAKAISAAAITSDYCPTASNTAGIIRYRLSINSRDNEMPDGQYHYAIAGDDTTVARFGVPQAAATADTAHSPNPRQQLRVDVSHILRSLEEQGYYATPTADTIRAGEFKGIWVAGDTQPLSWDYDNLYLHDELRLHPTGEDGIWSITLAVEPDPAYDTQSHSWSTETIRDDFPQLTSDYPLVDALYNMAADNIASCLRRDSTYRAGDTAERVLTRDIAFSTYLALAYLDPACAIKSLKARVRNERIVQDPGTGGSWPVATDRIAWVAAAWEIYKVTGNKEWLRYAYTVARNSIEDDRLVAQDHNTGLMHGEQACLDKRGQSYPRWMEPKDIYESMCLGTNVLFAQAFYILADMAGELGVSTDYYYEAKRLKDAINQSLWQESKGYYSAYLYGGINPVSSPTIDNLGQALSVIWDIADDGRAERLIERTPVSVYGTTFTYPRISGVEPYHNDAVWPFVQAFWNMAAARVGNEAALRHGLGAMYRVAALFGSHKELIVASTGDCPGDGNRLWSAAGNAAMVFRVLAGMSFKTRGIEFAPFIPSCFGGTIRLTGFRYRKAVIDLTIDGAGSEIGEIKIDGQRTDDNFFPASLKGHHTVAITMKPAKQQASRITVKETLDMPATPITASTGSYDSIVNVQKGVRYALVTSGKASPPSTDTVFPLPDKAAYTVTSVMPVGPETNGFISRPRETIPPENVHIYQCEEFAAPGTRYIDGKRGRDFVEITTHSNTDISIPVMAPAAGVYYIDVRYSNGNGPVNTGDRCAVRMLCVNTHLQGAVVMPQRGEGEWLNTGFSNMLRVELLSGKNIIQLIYAEPSNRNMNGNDNTALIDYIRVIKK